jgi:hypothetical protein
LEFLSPEGYYKGGAIQSWRRLGSMTSRAQLLHVPDARSTPFVWLLPEIIEGLLEPG